tara:strand:+ start:3076 stop:5892 length:2817 start_codon:yes stop_codon:yes gene_type:complete
MALSNAPSESNVNENWLFQFSADNDKCLEFDGTDDYVSFGNVLGLLTSFTLEAWIKPDVYSGSSGTQIILERSQDGSTAAKNTNWQIALRNNGLRCKYQYDTGSNVSNTVTTSAITANNWHHVAVLRDDSNEEMRFYVDGVKISTVTTNVSNDPTGGTSGVVSIGANFEENNEFDGEIAHARVWNVARSDSQIAHYYNRTIDSTESSLVGYWKLDEGTGSTVADSSSNSNSGTITGAEWSIGGFDQYIHSFGISTSDTTVDNNFYPGAVLNKNVSVRDSINITNGTSTTSNVSLNVANVVFDGIDLYKKILNGTNNYLNKEVRVYAQFNRSDSISNCQRIFTGRLVDIQLDEKQKLSLQINAHRPWDKIEFPQVKSLNDIYQPVAYGDYIEHGDKSLVREHTNALYPAPFKRKGITDDHLIITTKSHSDMRPHYYDRSADAFLPIKADNYIAQTKDLESGYDTNVNIGVVSRELQRRFRLNATAISSKGTSTFNNVENLTFDEYNGTNGIVHNFTGNNSTISQKDVFYNYACELKKINDSDVDIKGVIATPSSQVNADIFIKIRYSGASGNIYNGTYPANTTKAITQPNGLAGQVSVSDSAYGAIGISIANNNLNTVRLQTQITSVDSNDITLEIKITDLVLYFDIQESYDESKGLTNNSISTSSGLKNLYIGADGLTASWDNGAISHGHDIHRDLLMRFAGLGSYDPINYSALNTDRAIDNWKGRYWTLETVSLKDVLDKLAYEFSFCYKMDSSGLLKYIYVVQTSEYDTLKNNGNVLNMTKDDLSNIQISTNGLDELTTKMIVNNHLHPAETGRYYNSVTATNAETRAKYNLGAKEGIKTEFLDINVGTTPTSPNSDCNADFYSYYDNLIGEIKTIIKCNVVNPAKGCQLETGDIVTFTDMPVEMFGTDFSSSKYFMIVETKRSPGKVSITAREVG